jgi:hypothetical protein
MLQIGKRKLWVKQREEAGNPGRRMKCFVKMARVQVKLTSKKNGKMEIKFMPNNRLIPVNQPVQVQIPSTV